MNNSKIEIATGILTAFNEDAIKDIVEQRPWMRECTFTLLTKQTEVEQYIDKLIAQGICALDLESTGLNLRMDKMNESCTKLVGVCLAASTKDGVYIPVAHEDKEYNVPIAFVLRELKRLCASCRCIFHNFKYDGQLLRNYGIIIDDFERYEDTLLMAVVDDASRREKGLKFLSDKILGRPMLEIDELGIEGKNTERCFFMVPPPKALFYAAPDAVNTFALYELFSKNIDVQDPTRKSGPWAIYAMEKRCLFVTMEMERNYVRIDIDYLKAIRVEISRRLEELIKAIYDTVGREFDINSPKQLGPILFDEMKIPYPMKGVKTASGQYITTDAVLEKIRSKHPLPELIQTYRGLMKIVGTYVDNLIANADENNEVKFQLNQVQADTGRYSSTGGQGLLLDGYSGVNCQNIPKYNKKDPNSFNLRKALICRPGYKVVTIDYSGEELRIGANYSKEPRWLQEFLHGTGDLHTITGKIVTGKDKIDDKERGLGKTLNFLTLFGGGAGRFAQQAKIPYETAKKMIINFFNEYKVLKKWIDDEIKRSRKRGYARTVLGRRRPLLSYYNSPEKDVQAKGDRCAVNTAIQGCGADIIKIALHRIYTWINENGFQEDVRILIPVHDEIVFEIKEDKLDFYIPEISTLMKLGDVTKKLGWEVPLEVDAEYGDSFSVTNNYFEEQKEKGSQPKKEEVLQEVKQDTAENAVEKPQNLETVRDSVSEHKEADIKKMLEQDVPKIEDIKDNLVFNDDFIKNRVDKQGYFHYSLVVDDVAGWQFRAALVLLGKCSKIFVGPRYKVCLVDKAGTVLCRIEEEVSIDAFIVMCLWLHI